MISRLQVPPQPPPLRSSHPLLHPKPSLNPNTAPNPSPTHLQAPTPLKTLTPHIADSGLLFRQNLIYLQSLNINPTKALTKNPNIRSSSIQSIQSIEQCLYDMGIQQSDVGRIFDMYPQLLTCNVHRDLCPVFDFLLNEVHIPFGDVRKAVVRCPRLLVCSVEEQLRPALCFLRGLGFVGGNAVTSQTTMLLVSSVEGTLVPKIDYLRSLGFSHKEAVTMVLRSPGLLTFSILNNFQPKVEYFLKEMKGDLVELKRFPHYFSFSLEGRIKPRHRRLVEHGLSLPLSEMLKLSDGKFESWLVKMRLHSVDRKLSLCRRTSYRRSTSEPASESGGLGDVSTPSRSIYFHTFFIKQCLFNSGHVGKSLNYYYFLFTSALRDTSYV